jgi:hypothetical protein
MEIRVEAHEHIVLVTIANEKRRNAMTRAMMAELAALWDRLDGDPGCRCVVLTGTGEKAFSSGTDLAGDLSASAELAQIINRALLKDAPFSKPIVAAVNGDCVAGGLELLLSTDIRAAVPDARFGLPEIKWSIYPFGGATVRSDGPAADRTARRCRFRGSGRSRQPGRRARGGAAVGLGDRGADRRQQPHGGAGGGHADQRLGRRLREEPRSARTAAWRPRSQRARVPQARSEFEGYAAGIASSIPALCRAATRAVTR